MAATLTIVYVMNMLLFIKMLAVLTKTYVNSGFAHVFNPVLASCLLILRIRIRGFENVTFFNDTFYRKLIL